MANLSQLSIVLVGIIAALVALNLTKEIVAPIFLAITVGLMFGPVADALERRGVPDALSAGVVVILFLALIAIAGTLFVVPLGDWVRRLPQIWATVQRELANWKEPLESLAALQGQVKTILGADTAMEVSVQDGSAVTGVATTVPVIFTQILIFLASLYFFMATRDQLRIFVLSLCVSRRMRWRTAHVFRDVENKVSRFLLAVSIINVCMGIGVAILMALIGMPTPLLWGAMAAVLNFIPFVGQATMVVVLFVAGLGTQNGIGGAVLPVVLYLLLNFVEGNFVTPNLVGKAMTMNPFVIFMAITYWLWAWGPVGGFIAVPSLLVLYSIVTYTLPMKMPMPRQARRQAEAEQAAELAAEAIAEAKLPKRGEPRPAAPVN